MTAEPVPPDLDDLLARYGRPLIPPAPGFDPETLTRPVLEPATALELAGEGLLDPWLTGAMLQRYVALALLVGAGVALYGLASFVTGAYRLSDIKALMRRKNAN